MFNPKVSKQQALESLRSLVPDIAIITRKLYFNKAITFNTHKKSKIEPQNFFFVALRYPQGIVKMMAQSSYQWCIARDEFSSYSINLKIFCCQNGIYRSYGYFVIFFPIYVDH